MEFGGNTVLVTGGGSGIGLALAEEFLKAGSTVILCGRREEVLKHVQTQHPEFDIRVCDVGSAADRQALFEWVTQKYPSLNVLVNNAGIQQYYSLQEPPAWETMHSEIAINLEAPIHLSTLFIPHLAKQPRAVIANVSSGLAFVPAARVPVYCATKAALHSFTLSLRQQLLDTSIEVIEIIPPAVDTDLGGPGLHTHGVPVSEFTQGIVEQLNAGKTEVAYGSAVQSSQASRQEIDAIFLRMNGPR